MPVEMPEELPTGDTRKRNHESTGWTASLSSVSFFLLSVWLLKAYGLLHWEIIHERYSSLEEPFKRDLFHLLDFLEVYHFTALLAVIFGLRTFWTNPPWLRWVCLPMILASLIILVSIM